METIENTSYLCNLDDEFIEGILNNLSFQDIIYFAQTCSRVYNIYAKSIYVITIRNVNHPEIIGKHSCKSLMGRIEHNSGLINDTIYFALLHGNLKFFRYLIKNYEYEIAQAFFRLCAPTCKINKIKKFVKHEIKCVRCNTFTISGDLKNFSPLIFRYTFFLKEDYSQKRYFNLYMQMSPEFDFIPKKYSDVYVLGELDYWDEENYPNDQIIHAFVKYFNSIATPSNYSINFECELLHSNFTIFKKTTCAHLNVFVNKDKNIIIVA